MVYNGQQIKMKKSIIIIASLAAVVLFSSFVIFHNENNTSQIISTSEDCMSNAEAYVYNVDRSQLSSTGEIFVSVKVRNPEKRCYRIKVMPTRDIAGLIIEASQFTTWCHDDVNHNFSGPQSVTFKCVAGKEGDAQYCKNYDFHAMIVD